MKRLFLMFAMTVVTATLAAQTGNILTDRIIEQLHLYPQEKTYIHADAADYAPGDRVWLKVYVVKALSHEPVDESRYAYVELLDPAGTLVTRIRIMGREGLYAGYVDIPSSVVAGRYRLRSYTRLSAALPRYDSWIPLYIGGRKGSDRHTDSTFADTTSLSDADTAGALTYERRDHRIIVRTSLPGDSLFLMAHCRAYPFFLGPIAAQRPVSLLRDSIPQGVVSLLLVGPHGHILAERLLLSANDRERLRLHVVRQEAAATSADSVVLRLQAVGLHEGERADISVSVTSSVVARRHRPSSILAHLFLSTDVAGGLEVPENYYEHLPLADRLLASGHWSRYDFSRVFSGHFVKVPVTVESSQTITGRVRSFLRHRAVPNAPVSLISPQIGIAASTVSDAQGCFSFSGMDFPEGTEYVLRAVKPEGSELVELVVDEPDYPPFNAPVVKMGEEEAEEIPSDAPQSAAVDDGIMLDDVEVVTRRLSSQSRSDAYARAADFSFGQKEIREIDATCLHELLRRVPGVFVRENKCYIRATTTIYGDNPAAIVLDGVFLENDYDLDIIRMQDVARVDVFKTGTTAIWGTRGGSGVISITTKTGNYTSQAAEHLNQKKIVPLGYQKPVKFSAGLGIRKTLYWNPNVVSDRLSFSLGNTSGPCRMVVEGVTSEGRLIHEEVTLHARRDAK